MIHESDESGRVPTPFYKKWWFAVAVLPFVFILALGVYRVPAVLEQQETEEVVAFIEVQRITMEDVLGENLPPAPDPELADATIEGIDANNNGIRDDVELAIFERYLDEPEIRAAMLQYAMALQLELGHVFNSETWVAATQQIGRGFGCIYDAVGDEELNYVLSKKEEVEDLNLNTEIRKNHRNSLDGFQTSFSVLDGDDCDISFDEFER